VPSRTRRGRAGSATPAAGHAAAPRSRSRSEQLPEEAPGPPSERPPGPADEASPAQGPVAPANRHHGPGPLPRGLLAGAAALLGAWSATTVLDRVGLDRLDLLLVGLATTAPATVVLAVPVVTAAVRRRRWITAAVAAAAGLLPWLFVLGYAVPGPPADAAAAPVRAMLVDADRGGADPPSLVATVLEQGVDVLVVTGLSSSMAHDLTVAGLDGHLRPRWVDVPTDGSPAGTGLWSRADVTGIEPVRGTTTPAVRALLQGKAPLTLVAGRAASPQDVGVARWRADLDVLGGAARSPGPVAVLGNLDATPWQPEFRRLTGSGLSDAADAAGRGLRSTWPSWSPVPLLPVDHVLVGGGVDARDVETIPLAGTDHRALVVTLLVPPG